MRKFLSNSIVALFSFAVLLSCSRDNLGSSIQEETAIFSKFDDFKEIAKIHSEGLDYFYNEYIKNGQINALNTRSSEYLNESLKKECNTSAEVFVERHKQKISEFPHDFHQYLNLTRSTQNLKEEEKETSLHSFIETVMDKLDNIIKVEDVEDMIKQEFLSIEFLAFGESEQNLIMGALAVYIDSFDYWKNNLGTWNNHLGENASVTRRITPGEREMIGDASQNKYVRSDVWGAVTGGILGGLRGMITGAIAASAGTAIGV